MQVHATSTQTPAHDGKLECQSNNKNMQCRAWTRLLYMLIKLYENKVI